MADRDCKDPEIKILRPSGIDLRSGRNAIADQHGDRIHGLWPKQTGLLQRFPGHTLMRQVGDKVYQLCQTFDGSGNILCQIGNTVQAFTLDELKNIQSDVDIEASVGNEEDQVGIAILVDIEPDGQGGGSADGFLTGVSTATANTFYGARLTNMLINETVNTLQTVNTFTASTGGSGVVSTPGTFVLVPGTYRIDIRAVYSGSGDRSVVLGLYNSTSAAFEVYAGTTTPIIAQPHRLNDDSNYMVSLQAAFTVSSSNKTYYIAQECSNAAAAQSLSFCGTDGSATGLVNAAAPNNTYKIIRIYRMS